MTEFTALITASLKVAASRAAYFVNLTSMLAGVGAKVNALAFVGRRERQLTEMPRLGRLHEIIPAHLPPTF